MKRGELYRVYKPEDDPKRYRTYVVVSRPILIESKFSTVICAPVFTSGDGLSTQVAIGPHQGMKHASFITCDNLVSIRKTDLSHYVGALSKSKLAELDRALKIALALD